MKDDNNNNNNNINNNNISNKDNKNDNDNRDNDKSSNDNHHNISTNTNDNNGNNQYNNGMAVVPLYGISLPQQQQQQPQPRFSPFHSHIPNRNTGLSDRSLQQQPPLQNQILPLYSSNILPPSVSSHPHPHSHPLTSSSSSSSCSSSSSSSSSLPTNHSLSSIPIQEGIEADILPESAFSSVAWLRQYGMHMYRWAGDSSEWTEYAMHLPINILPYFTSTSTSTSGSASSLGGYTSILQELLTSGCQMWIDKEILLDREATFLVFIRGIAGNPNNAFMNIALDLLSNRMQHLLPQILFQLQSFGSVGSHRVNTPPSLPLPPLQSSLQSISISIPLPQKPPLSAWGVGNSLISTTTRMGNEFTVDINMKNDEEEHSIISDEYYDPEDLARSLSIAGENHEDQDADWCTVPSKRTLSSLPSTRRPEPLRLGLAEGQAGGYVQRWLEIPRDSVGLVIGQGGKKIKDLCHLSNAKIQFRVNKTAEREGRPGLLELQGTADNVDLGLQLVWDLLHLFGKEYQEVPVQRVK